VSHPDYTLYSVGQKVWIEVEQDIYVRGTIVSYLGDTFSEDNGCYAIQRDDTLHVEEYFVDSIIEEKQFASEIKQRNAAVLRLLTWFDGRNNYPSKERNRAAVEFLKWAKNAHFSLVCKVYCRILPQKQPKTANLRMIYSGFKRPSAPSCSRNA
jgi:hypothetical protein